MTYQPYLVADFSTGVDVKLQPWLSPDDAQQQLYDGYVYRGVMSKRPGYKGFATGGRGGAPYTDSRVIGDGTGDRLRSSVGVLIVGDGTVGPYVFKTPEAAVRRGSVRITATFGGGPTILEVTDTGLDATVLVGNLEGDVSNNSTSRINYRTGVGTVTFSAVIPAATAIFINYSFELDEPVMGIMNYVDQFDTKVLLVATTTRLNIYNPLTNRFDYLGNSYQVNAVTPGVTTILGTIGTVNLVPGDSVYVYGLGSPNELNNNTYVVTAVGANTITIDVDSTAFPAFSGNGFAQQVYTGNKFNFWSWVNYRDGAGNPRLIFTNNKDQVQYYAPLNVATPVGDYVIYPSLAAPQFLMFQDGGTTPVTTLQALQVFNYKDRLQFQRTTEEGTVKPQRIRISGTGVNSDNFTLTAIGANPAGIGAGAIDIPDGTWIMGAASNRDDMVTFTEGSTWIQQYTGNDTVPIKIARIDESRGSGAAFSVITYLNRTTAASKRGLIISDGYRVERADDVIPDFSFEDIKQSLFQLCFVGVVDDDRDHYLIYPTPASTESNNILVTNYDEDNYGIYRIPLSCMGVFQNAFDITWDDLNETEYPNWDVFSSKFSNWNGSSQESAAPFAVGGGHHGEVWMMNVDDSEDNPQQIRSIVSAGTGILEITTDWNNYSTHPNNDNELPEDYVSFEGILGMTQLNDKQFPIETVIDNYTFQIKVDPNINYSTHVPNSGIAIRVIPFTATFKQFNPFLNMDKKVRCGWIYFYVSTSGTNLTANYQISGIQLSTVDDPRTVISTTKATGLVDNQQVGIFGIVGTTQLNDTYAFVRVITPTSFELVGVDSSAYTPYISQGYITVDENTYLQVQIFTNDANEAVVVSNVTPQPWIPNCSNLVLEDQSKKWYKLYVNQVGKFLQLKVSNVQSGANIDLHATIYGFQAVGRII